MSHNDLKHCDYNNEDEDVRLTVNSVNDDKFSSKKLRKLFFIYIKVRIWF